MTEQEQRIKDLEAQLAKATTQATITDAILSDLYSGAWADGWKACLERPCGGKSMTEQERITDQAWEVAKAIASIDKQLLSSRAVEAFAEFAEQVADERSEPIEAQVADLQRQLADSQARECKLREALKKQPCSCKPIPLSEIPGTWLNDGCTDAVVQCARCQALSSTAPCPHEKQKEELQKYIDGCKTLAGSTGLLAARIYKLKQRAEQAEQRATRVMPTKEQLLSAIIDWFRSNEEWLNAADCDDEGLTCKIGGLYNLSDLADKLMELENHG